MPASLMCPFQANVASYDWSALLYLSSAGIDFEGLAAGDSKRTIEDPRT